MLRFDPKRSKERRKMSLYTHFPLFSPKLYHKTHATCSFLDLVNPIESTPGEPNSFIFSREAESKEFGDCCVRRRKMSAPKKRAFQIEAFKGRVVVDPKDEEKLWNTLEEAIHEIYNHNASGLNMEELYRTAYNMVLHKFGEKLYSGLLTTMTFHLKEMCSSIEAAQGELFLEELNRKWEDHKKALQIIRDMLMYMDRTFIPSTHKTPVHELGLNLWRDVVIHSSKIQTRLQDTLVELIQRERGGEVINRELMRNITKMLKDIGSSVYQDDFEEYSGDEVVNTEQAQAGISHPKGE